MSNKSVELRKQRAAIVAKMHDLTAPEQRENWEKADKEQDALRVQIEAIEKTDALDKEMNALQSHEGTKIETADSRSKTGKLDEIRSSDKYREDFRNYLRNGSVSSTLNEVRTYSPLDDVTGANGAYLIPTGFQKELEIKLKAYGGMRRNSRVITTATGNTLNWPSMDDTSNTGEWLSVNSSTSQLNPSFGQVQFTSNLASSKQVLVPVQLIQDSAFDIESELVDAFAIRLGRTTNAAYTNGTGSGQPNGLVNNITNIVTAVGANDNSGNSGDTEANSIGSDDLAALIKAVDPAYRPNAIFMANQGTFDHLRALKDKYGRPLWLVSIASGDPDRLMGYRYDWNQDMTAVGAGVDSLVFGDFSKYVVRDVLGITAVRFNELFMSSYQIGFQSYLRTDGQILQQAAFAKLHNPLS